MANKGKAKDKDKHRRRNKDTSDSSSGTRRHHNMDSIRILDSRNVTQMRWTLTGIRHEGRL